MAEHSSHRKQFWGVSRSLVSCCASWKSPGSNLFFLSLFLLFLIRLIIWHHFIMSVTREQPHKATNFPCSWCSFCIFLLKSDSKAVFTFLLTDYIYILTSVGSLYILELSIMLGKWGEKNEVFVIYQKLSTLILIFVYKNNV